MHILQIASELAPIAKVGGLGDVVYGLSKELVRLGHFVEIILPKYDCLDYREIKNLQLEQSLPPLDGSAVWSAEVHGLKVLLLESHHPDYFFNRGAIYGCKDDILRFTHFCKSAVHYFLSRKKSAQDSKPYVIHVHDWPTALIPALLKECKNPLVKTVFTIHNMEHQGKCTPSDLKDLGIQVEDYFPPQINLLKAGIVYADQVTTVSPTYEKEIQTAQGGFGLEDTLTEHRKKLKGILNGIDEEFWNPAKDPHLIQNYQTAGVNKTNLDQLILAKKKNKQHLQDQLGLKRSEAPLVASVSRLVPQKSPELIKHALLRTLEKGGQFVLLGSSSTPSIHEEFEALQKQLKESKNAAILMDRDEALAHQIFAAADLFVIPSLFEPCGLTQMIALSYAAIPIARMTGGLCDTVFDIDTSTHPLEERCGFTFDFPDSKGVDWALDRALDCYLHQKEKWQTLLIQACAKDFSWKQSALDYLKVYLKL